MAVASAGLYASLHLDEVFGVVVCLERGAGCLHMVQLMPLHPETPSSLASFKSRLVLPFWYWLTQVVLEKWPLDGCSSVVVDYVASLSHISHDVM